MTNPKPNLFIVGAPKCGTTSLAAYLDEHPNVFISDPKEPFFWSFDYPGLQQRHRMDSPERYMKLFEDANDQHIAIGEGSTNYLRSSEAIPQIMEFNKDAKFIAMLRNPVEVVHAFHAEILFSYIEDVEDFETAWRLQEERQQGKSIPANCEAPQFLQYGQVASYAEQIERLMDLVPESQRQIIVFDDFKSSTATVFEESQRFLGLEPIEKESFEAVNAAHGHRSEAIANVVLNPPPVLRPVVEGIRQLARTQKGGLIDQAKQWMRTPKKRKPMTQAFRTELAEYFSDDVKRLSGLLGRDLSHWLRPDLPADLQSLQEDTAEETVLS